MKKLFKSNRIKHILTKLNKIISLECRSFIPGGYTDNSNINNNGSNKKIPGI